MDRFGKLKWYAARLAVMSPAEVLHRVHEMRARKKLANHAGGWESLRVAALAAPDFARIRNALASTGVERPSADLRFLNHDIEQGSGAGGVLTGREWFRDPVSRKYWPGADHSPFDIDVRSTSASPKPGRPFGDIKFVLEMNRLQMLHPLACDIAREGTSGDAWQLAMSWISSWMEANPPYRGVNWSSGIEIALRIVSVGLVASAVKAESVPDQDRIRLARFISAHAHWLGALPSLHSSANNHRVAEGLGLYLAGLLLRDQRFAEEGRDILQSQTLEQIYPDGVGVEQSPTYQAFTMELIGLGALFGAAAGSPFEEAVLARLGKGTDFLAALLDARGRAPAIGDDDEGRVLTQPGVDEPHYVASVTSSIARFVGRSVAAFDRPGYMREALFESVEARVEVAPADKSLKQFNDGGYSVVRKNTCGHDVHLMMDHGPLGLAPLSAHGHADALSIWLNIDDKPVFIDPGTWLYHSGEGLRNDLRSSSVHNTLSIANQSQSVPSSAFSWSSAANAQAIALKRASRNAAEAETVVGGEHDGYRKRFGVRHIRQVSVSSSDLVIEDRLVGRAGVSQVEIAFLCAPDIVLVEDKGSIILQRDDTGSINHVLTLHIPDGFSAQLVRGQNTQGRGIYSPRFGALAEAAHIVLRGTLSHDDETKPSGQSARIVLSLSDKSRPAEMGA